MSTRPREQRRFIHFPISPTKEMRDEWQNIWDERKKLEAREYELIKRARQLPEVKPAMSLAGYVDGNIEIRPSLGGGSWVATASINEVIDAAPDPSPLASYRPNPITQLDPKTINLLLSSKILTGEQKQRLVARLVPDILEEGQKVEGVKDIAV